MVTQHLLTDTEIRHAIAAVREGFVRIAEIRLNHPGGRYLQFPKIPSILSESIIAKEIREGRSPFDAHLANVTRGGSVADLLVEPGARRVEVKATGAQGFQYFGPKDIETDTLVWLHFSSAFGETNSQVTAYWLDTPSMLFPEPTKITLVRFRQIAASRISETQIQI